MASAPVFLMAEKKEIGRQKDVFQLILTFSTQPNIQKHDIKVQYPQDREQSMKVQLQGAVIYTLHLPGDIDVEKASEKVSGKRLIITVPKLEAQCWLARGRCSPSRSSSDSSS